MIFLLAFLGFLQLYTIEKLLDMSYRLHHHIYPFLHEEEEERFWRDDK